MSVTNANLLQQTSAHNVTESSSRNWIILMITPTSKTVEVGHQPHSRRRLAVNFQRDALME